ncbi:MAG: hypothetical protein GY699_17665 [Desulfobacteraceae bacterium]|nr:hypothetical protein [Desulfobacteraceae bacterium]
MTGFLKKGFILIVFCAVCLTGCSKPVEEKAPDFLIKTSLITIDSSEFSEELDLKRAAYPYNINENPAEYNEMVMHLVKMLSEEIILLSIAAEKNVTVNDQELQAAEDEFRKDYPDDSFDQILLKNAISYSFWKKGFKKNMIMDKLIDQELKKKIEITPEDIVEFYKKYSVSDTQGPDKKVTGLTNIEDENQLVSRLRMQKTQENYDEWIKQLWNAYPVEINEDKLRFFLIGIKKNEGSDNEKED